jgi:hypothetical protein
MLSVLSKLLILIEQLRRIAARPAIDPVGGVAAPATRIAISATTAAIIAIVIQRNRILV